MKFVELLFKTGVVASVALLASVSGAAANGLTVSVPEPSALALVAVGVLGVIAASRWRK